MKSSVLSVKKIANNLILKQESGKHFFMSTSDSVIISVTKLSLILKFLLENNFISPKVLEGILEEYYMFKGDK